jgi:hypothetical protein
MQNYNCELKERKMEAAEGNGVKKQNGKHQNTMVYALSQNNQGNVNVES